MGLVSHSNNIYTSFANVSHFSHSNRGNKYSLSMRLQDGHPKYTSTLGD